ncbi:hypothetical protein lerEdw1_012218, partial [Lerista edwardsae]
MMPTEGKMRGGEDGGGLGMGKGMTLKNEVMPKTWEMRCSQRGPLCEFPLVGPPGPVRLRQSRLGTAGDSELRPGGLGRHQVSSRAVPGPLFTCRNAARPALDQLSVHPPRELAAVASTLLPALFFPPARGTRGRLLPPVGHVLRPPAAAQPRLVLTLLQAQGRGKLARPRLEGAFPGERERAGQLRFSPALAAGRGLVGREELGRLHRSIGGKSPMGPAASRVENPSREVGAVNTSQGSFQQGGEASTSQLLRLEMRAKSPAPGRWISW